MTGQRDGGGSARPSPALCGGLTLCFLSRPANPCARPLDETPGSQGTELRVVAEAEAGKQRVAPSACVSGSAPVCCSQLAACRAAPVKDTAVAASHVPDEGRFGKHRPQPLAQTRHPPTQNTATRGALFLARSLLPREPAVGPGRRPLDRCQSSTSAPLIYFALGRGGVLPPWRREAATVSHRCPFSERAGPCPPPPPVSRPVGLFFFSRFFCPARSPVQAEALGGRNGGLVHEVNRADARASPCIAETPLGGACPAVRERRAEEGTRPLPPCPPRRRVSRARRHVGRATTRTTRHSLGRRGRAPALRDAARRGG